jgi:type II secretory pathway pseudopilin PulG
MMKSKTNQPRSSQAFTLVELLVALAIIIILTVLTIPALEPMINASGVDTGASSIRAALQHARYAAVAQHDSASCWIATGSLMDQGALMTVSANPQTVSVGPINIDDRSSSPEKSFESTSGWSKSSTNADYYPFPGEIVLATPASTATETCTWNFTIPTPDGMEGTGGALKVEAHVLIKDNAVNDANFIVFHEGGSTVCKVNTFGARELKWVTLGGTGTTFNFLCGGTYKVTLDNFSEDSTAGVDRVFGDAIRITGEVGERAGDPATQFVASGKTWTENRWAPPGGERCYVTIAHPTSSGGTVGVISPIASNTDTEITAATPWRDPSGSSVTLVDGSPFIITVGDPRRTLAPERSVGSGTASNFVWNKLPTGVVVCPYRINNDGSESTTPAFPILFNSLGRALFTPAYVTLKIYATTEDGTAIPDMVRYLRVFRNTGRVYAARKIADLPG